MSDGARAIEADLIRYYDQESAERSERAVDPPRVAARVSFLARLRDEGRTSLLEIGTGRGRDAGAFLDEGLGVVGIDLSSEHARRASALGAGVAVASVRSLPFRGGVVPALWSMSTLMHVPDIAIADALDEVARVLSSGAVAAIGVWGGPDVEDHSDVDRYDPPRFFSRRSDDRWRALLTSHIGEVEAFETWSRDDDFWYQFAVVRKT